LSSRKLGGDCEEQAWRKASTAALILLLQHFKSSASLTMFVFLATLNPAALNA
jgi:hypothetical protein